MVAEIRSVNAKGLEVRFRLPQELFPIEEQFRLQVQQVVARGRVDVTLGWDGPPPATSRFLLNEAGAEAMLNAWHRLRERFGLSDLPTAEGLLRLPGVIEPAPSPDLDAERLGRIAQGALAEALKAHREAREREGRRLAHDLAGRMQRIMLLADEIDLEVTGSAERMASTLKERVQQLLGEVQIDEQRMVQEIAILAQKADVTEEQVRLRAHLQRFQQLFAAEAKEIGRNLEFLVQEIRREVSTLTAKTSSTEIDARSLAIRAELERIREQAANLE